MNRSAAQKELELATVRPSIQCFAIEMEKRLQQSGYMEPGWWHDCDPAFLGVKLANEIDELLENFSVDKCNTCAKSYDDCKKCDECLFSLPDGSVEKSVDIANLCMMVWSKKGNS